MVRIASAVYQPFHGGGRQPHHQRCIAYFVD